MFNPFVNFLPVYPSLKNAQVICLSDFHYDTVQKYIRARIINEVLHVRNTTCKEIFILVEGTQAGYEPDEGNYNHLVGDNLINFDHFVAGWDNMKLHNSGMNLIKEMQRLRADGQEIGKKYSILNKKKSEILKDVNISPKKIFVEVDSIEVEMNTLLAQAEKISTSIGLIFERIKELAHKRNDSLYKSINTVLEKHPKSIVFVISGENHFKYLSEAINDISHCILNIQEIRVVIDVDEALEEVYGNFSSQLSITDR